MSKQRAIKFFTDYEKLPRGWHEQEAKLIHVEIIDLKNQTEAFLRYDTKYRHAHGGYKLPTKGEYLLLLFISKHGAVFTTLRRATPQKTQYYTDLRGSWLKLELSR